jgi:hypothetical protein
MLGFREKEHGGNRLAEVLGQIASIFGNAYDFVLTRPQTVPAEVLSERIFIREKFPRKRLIDDRHALRSRVLSGNTATFKNRIPYSLKVSSGHSIHRSEVVISRSRRRMTIYPDATPPIAAAQRRVFAEGHCGNAGNARKGITDAPVKWRELVQAVAGEHWVRHYPSILLESKILILQAVQRSREQS